MDLPEEIVNHICCLAIKLRDPLPFLDDIKTLNLIDEIVQRYIQEYNDDAFEWLILDLDNYFPTDENNWGWGVYRKWNSLTAQQRRSFVTFLDNGMVFV